MFDIYTIIFFSTLSVLLIFSAIIISIRSKRSIISDKEEKDFIDNYIDNKKASLKAKPGIIKFKTFITLAVILCISFGLISWFLTKKLWIMLIAMIVGWFIPDILVFFTERKQKQNFEVRYARALRQLSSSLRAGMTLQQSVADLCACPFIHYDIKKEFKKIDADIKVGISVADAFENMAKRIPTMDVQDVASSIKMQSMVGGSEAEVIEHISNNITSRIMLRKEIKTIFAGIRVTAMGMEILPVLMVIGIMIAAPEYFEPCLKTTLGKIGFVGAGGMMLIGTFVTQRILKDVKG